MSQRMKSLLVVGMILCLVLALSLSVLAAKGGSGEGVEVKARVAGQILLSIESGDRISFEVDPLNNHEDTAETELLVMTNARDYTIIATFGRFAIDNYDLITNEKFFIRSMAPGSGQSITSWTAPVGEIAILKNEDGMTAGEITLVEYMLQVDFTVPPGEGQLEIAFTAVAAL